MQNEIIINSASQETRIAIIEKGRVVELFIERESDLSIVGSIYKGRVIRVLPGMEAAFVDIGLSRGAFLYVRDIRAELEEYEVTEEEIARGALDENLPLPARGRRIQDRLKVGQTLLVQVSKAPIGTKGARVTTLITIPGRQVVLMPFVSHIGISRRIEKEAERKRLRAALKRIVPKGMGLIARTVSRGESQETLRADLDGLLRAWEELQRSRDRLSAPALLYQEPSPSLRVIRDYYTSSTERVVVDDPEAARRIRQFVGGLQRKKAKGRVAIHRAKDPIFDHYGIEINIEEALRRRVWLKSGGYIVIDQTEALTTIDVNTGRYVGKHNLEDTILKTNIEAAREIVHQLRLRNIGGIIVLDFIDMETPANREQLEETMREALKEDKAKTNIQNISELGLIEMTRKRTRKSLRETLCQPCAYCDAKGYVKSPRTTAYRVFREILREAERLRGAQVVINVHPEVADLIRGHEKTRIKLLEDKVGKRIAVRSHGGLHIEQYRITSA